MSPEIVVDLAAIRHNVRTLRELTGVAVDDGGQGRRLRPRDRRGRPAPPARRAASGSASPPSTRRSPLRAAGDTGRLLCWLTMPGDDWAAAIDADVDVTAYSVAELDEIAATGRPARRPAQGRHRPLPRRRHARRLARGRRPRPRGRGGRQLAGHRHLVPLRRQRRARPPRERRPGAGLPRRAGARRGGRAAPRGPPPRQLRRRHPAPVEPLRPGPVRAGVVRPRPGARPDPRPRPGPGDDRPRAAR